MPDRYRELLEHLFKSRRAGVVLGLERVEAALDRLGHPERCFAARVHIGGTNGKGSTAAFVESIVRQAGKRTGLFTSPHLSQFRERFVVAGQPARHEAIVDAARAVHAAGGRELTFFEQVTLIALCLFARARVEVAVLEVGLGGRLDATNAVAAEVAAVTGVALDHQDYLGTTLAAIAGEKAGIFKPGQRVVVGAAGEPAAVPLLCELARARAVEALTVISPPGLPDSWILGLPGAHQRCNAACALAILDHLAARDLVTASDRDRRDGLTSTRLPGRFETVQRDPRVIIDGAHNPHAAAMLAEAVIDLPRPLVLLASVCRDKDVAGVLAPLGRVATAIVATQCRNERTLPARDLAGVAAEVAPDVPCQAEARLDRAIAQAIAQAGPTGTVLIAGSLYLAGEARQVLCGDAADPMLLGDPVEKRGTAVR